MTEYELFCQEQHAHHLMDVVNKQNTERLNQRVEALEAALSAKQGEQEPYDKTEMNAFVQNLYDQKMREGRHGHYETMFHVVHQAIKRVHPAPSVNQQLLEALKEIEWSNNSKWQSDRARAAIQEAEKEMK